LGGRESLGRRRDAPAGSTVTRSPRARQLDKV
jgi:hypothetical protein